MTQRGVNLIALVVFQKYLHSNMIKKVPKDRRYYVFHILPQIYTANHTTFPIQMYAITV